MKTPNVVVAGHICLDITPVFQQNKGIEVESPAEKGNVRPELFKPGSLLHMEGVDIHTGGCVANTGLAMRIFGAKTRLVGKIGNDELGKILLDILKGYEAEEGMIISDHSRTSYSIVISPPQVDRIFLHDPGANDSFCAEDLDDQVLEGMEHFHFGYPPIMEKMYENDGEQLVLMMKKVKELGLSTSLDMAAIDENSKAGQADWRKILAKTLPFVDCFLPSVEELAYMLQPQKLKEWVVCAKNKDLVDVLDIEQDVAPMAEELLCMGAKIVLVKCGSRGMYLRTATSFTQAGTKSLIDRSWENLAYIQKSYQVKQVVSATGAGDTSIAAFLTAFLQGRTPIECVKYAAAAGAACVTEYDALSGLRPLEQLVI